MSDRKPKLEILSLWRNDADRNLAARVEHLLSKTSEMFDLSWRWIVGDSSDSTARDLLDYRGNRPVSVFAGFHTGIEGTDVASRRRRSSATATRLFSLIAPDTDYVLLHESDLISPPNVADLLYDPWQEFNAGWPVIPFEGGERFYDIWAYRHLDGRHFRADEPRPDKPFRVSSFGSVWIAPADAVCDRVLDERCIVGLCEQWTDSGHALWVRPHVTITQPVDLWTPA